MSVLFRPLRTRRTSRWPIAGRLGPPQVLLSVLLISFVGGALLEGCSARTKRKWDYRSAAGNLNNALEAKHPDDRRDGVARIGESKYFDSENAFYVLDVVARTDPQTQIRCIAIRTLARYRDDRPIGTLLAVLQATEGDKRALAADDDIRWEAALALMLLAEQGFLTGEQRDTACNLYIDMTAQEQPRRVRIAGCAALGTFQNPKVFPPLISALRDPDFAISDRAEQSLIQLTGVTHHYSADAWAQWVAEADDPFANAGHIPHTTRPSGPSWWDKQIRAWRRGLKLAYD